MNTDINVYSSVMISSIVIPARRLKFGVISRILAVSFNFWVKISFRVSES